MGTTTFSGPIKAGTIKDTTGTTVGTDVKNVGFTKMVQSNSGVLTGASTTQVIGTIPANSQVVDVKLDITEVSDATNASSVSIGTSANATLFTVAANAQVAARTTMNIAAIATAVDIGNTDVQVIATLTNGDGDATTGTYTATVEYVQNTNLS